MVSDASGMKRWRTVREARQYAQKTSAAVQAEKRLKARETDRARIAEDRRLARDGLQFVSRYTPPSVVPDGATCISLVDCELPYRQAYARWRRESYDIHPRSVVGQQVKERAHRKFTQFLESEAGTLYVNVAALQAVTFILGAPPLWIRVRNASWDKQTLGGPPSPKWWEVGWFMLAVRITAPCRQTDWNWVTDGAGRSRYMHFGASFWLKSHDLLSHHDRPDRELPAEAHASWGQCKVDPAGSPYHAWHDALTAHNVIYLTGLPMGFGSLKTVVRQMVGAWVEMGRGRRLPWAQQTGSRW